MVEQNRYVLDLFEVDIIKQLMIKIPMQLHDTNTYLEDCIIVYVICRFFFGGASINYKGLCCLIICIMLSHTREKHF